MARIKVNLCEIVERNLKNEKIEDIICKLITLIVIEENKLEMEQE